MSTESAFVRLHSIIVRLRGADGCPWDRKQTPQSMLPYVLEEAYECLEALVDRDHDHVCEEAGDLFMLITMISYMEEQAGHSTVEKTLETVSDKLIRRHPHVFAEIKLETSDQVVSQWAEIKTRVEGRNDKESVLNKVPKTMPPLERAYQLQRRASEVGFDWTSLEDVRKKVAEETAELETATNTAPTSTDTIAEEYGDLLFALVNFGRHLKLDPAVALHAANEKFRRRFSHVETRMNEENHEMSAKALEVMDSYWNEAKVTERSRNGNGTSR